MLQFSSISNYLIDVMVAEVNFGLLKIFELIVKIHIKSDWVSQSVKQPLFGLALVMILGL